jgi:hypothetical protein
MNEDNMVPMGEAERQVAIVVKRLAMLHLAFTRTLVAELGWKAAKPLILKSIKHYGELVARRVARGDQSLPSFGFFEKREGKPDLCELGKVMLEEGEPRLGSLYCLIDVAKTMAADPGRKLVHDRCMLLGHDECVFSTLETKPQEVSDFQNDHDWAYLDQLIGEFLDEEV